MNEISTDTKMRIASVVGEQSEMMSLITRALTDPAITPEKLNGLYDFKLRLYNRAAEIEANAAFQRVCSNMPVIRKNGLIDFGKGAKPIAYAKWEDIARAIKPIYEAENFTLSFDTKDRTSGMTVIAKLLHANGYLITSEFPVPLDSSGGKQNIQGMGSSGTYGQRYATKNLFNLIFEGEDDDGKLGAVSFITSEQKSAIQGLLGETKTDEAAFLRIFQLADLDSMEKSVYTGALNMLITKKGAMKK